MNWIDEATNDKGKSTELLSFYDYMELFEKNPERECRPTYKYLSDMLSFFGKDDNDRFKLFQQEHIDSPAVFGQEMPENRIFENLKSFHEEGKNNKFILLVGPNGSSKSSLVRKFMKGAEEYSKKPEGALYTFSWIFPVDTYVKGSLGLTGDPGSHNLNSYAYLDDKDITAILPSELKDHPLLLVPLEYREKLIEDHLEGNSELLDTVRKSYLFTGDLSKRNRMIYDALLKNYKGDHNEVLKHIRVERFYISKRYSTGAVTIEPQLHVDARMQQITMDKRLGSLPPSLQSLNLFSLQGEAVLANRGILEFSDLLKRPMDAFKYLLTTMETSHINLNGIMTQLDIFFLGTSNEIHLAAFKQHPDFNSFKGRFNFIRVPYLLDYKQESKIYAQQIAGLENVTKFEPHALRLLCLFAIMTRLRPCQAKNYSDKKLAHIATGLNPLEKTLLLAKEIVPERLDSESKQILRQNLAEIKKEFVNENLYEGKFGISPRDIKSLLYDIAGKYKTVTVYEILESIEDLCARKNDFDFLNIAPQGDYHHPGRFLALLREYASDKFDKELRSSLGLVDERSYEEYIGRYINNIKAMMKGEKVKNQITGKYETSDDYFIKEFESSIDLKEKPETYRSHLISKLGAYSLDNPGKTLVYTDVFPDLSNKLKESFRNEQKKQIKKISKSLMFYERELESGKESTSLSKDDRKEIETILDNLMNQYNYTKMGSMSLLKNILRDRY